MERPMAERIITESAWDEEFVPIHDSPLELDAPLVKAVDAHHVWTACDTGSGSSVICNGFHRFNRFGYWITLNPWSDGEVVVVDLDDNEGDENEEDEDSGAANR